ncbi:hypothetical protein L1987_55212 [Smallanthus sonchifolius]|uniref:Uncharacterized protein n=1 Tax=Smallanthus sonchifolius TaxID=185202 RepID=A0ACB9E907_9ASTR|nr:hypothetical protein L1987_55212 [Smallanthus sonchifolius]
MANYGGHGNRHLEVTVLGCNKLKDTEWISRQDPYVCLEYGSTRNRTRVCTDGGKNPTFQEKFSYSAIEGLRELNIIVWNNNTISRDDFIGSGKVHLGKVLSEGYDDSSWPLQTKHGRHAGECLEKYEKDLGNTEFITTSSSEKSRLSSLIVIIICNRVDKLFCVTGFFLFRERMGLDAIVTSRYLSRENPPFFAIASSVGWRSLIVKHQSDRRSTGDQRCRRKLCSAVFVHTPIKQTLQSVAFTTPIRRYLTSHRRLRLFDRKP